MATPGRRLRQPGQRPVGGLRELGGLGGPILTIAKVTAAAVLPTAMARVRVEIKVPVPATRGGFL